MCAIQIFHMCYGNFEIQFPGKRDLVNHQTFVAQGPIKCKQSVHVKASILTITIVQYEKRLHLYTCNVFKYKNHGLKVICTH